MPWSVAAAVGGAVVSSALAPSSSGSGSAAAAADPFASQRAQYQTQLSSLMSGNYNMSSDPSYNYQLQQGTDNLNRGLAASGAIGSGQQMAELQTYGQNMASTDFSNQYQRLAQLAGGNIGSPAEAGQILANQQGSQQSAASALGNTVGGLFNNSNVQSSLSNWWNSATSSAAPAVADASTQAIDPFVAQFTSSFD